MYKNRINNSISMHKYSNSNGNITPSYPNVSYNKTNKNAYTNRAQ